ncbi:hypothetical protein D3C81_2109380 [compost metagenome]
MDTPGLQLIECSTPALGRGRQFVSQTLQDRCNLANADFRDRIVLDPRNGRTAHAVTLRELGLGKPGTFTELFDQFA